MIAAEAYSNVRPLGFAFGHFHADAFTPANSNRPGLIHTCEPGLLVRVLRWWRR